MGMRKRDYEELAATLGRAVAVEASEGGGEGSLTARAAYRVALALADTLRASAIRSGGLFLDAVDRASLSEAGGLSYGAERAVEDALAQRRTGSRF